MIPRRSGKRAGAVGWTLSLGVRVGMGVPVGRVRVGEAVQWTTTTTTTHVQSFDQ